MDILDIPIDDLELSVRTLNCLKHDGIKTLREAAALGSEGLMQIPNFGRKSLNEINEIMASQGVNAIGGRKLRYFCTRLPDEVFAALELRAKANDRSLESEAAILIGNALGNPPPAASLPERVARLEAAIVAMGILEEL